MEILKNFGFDPVIMVAQIINFLIILYLLKRFMYKPVLAMLKKRQEDIAESIKQAEQAKAALDKAMLEEKNILEKAKTEASLIIEDAKSASLEISRQMEESTKKQAENLILQAKIQIEQDTKQAEEKLVEKLSLIAQEMLKKGLEGILTQKEQKEIAQRTLKNIKKPD